MKYYLSVTLLMLTMSGGLSVAADPPAQSAPSTPTSPINPIDPRTDSKPIQAVGAKTPKNDDLGYTQIGRHFTLKFDRPKTELSLYENSTYSIYAERDDVGIFNPGSRLIKIEDADPNGISFHTIAPGMMTLTFVNDEETEVKQYTVEVTILGDTRQLQTQLDKLYPRASIKAIKVGESVLLRGTTSKQEHIAEIIEIAEQFYPKTLNQLKVAGAPVVQPPSSYPQSLPTQPQVTRGYEPTEWTRSIPSPLNPILASPAKTTKQQVTVEAIVLEIDWKKLKETKINLGNTIRAFATDPAQRRVSFQATKKSSFVPVVVPWHTTAGILHLLTATKAVKIISQPIIRTQVGRSADILIGEKIPIVETKEIRNGKQVLETGYHNIGTTLKVTPEAASFAGTKLSVFVDHKQRAKGSVSSIPEGSEIPNIESHKFNLAVELKVGQSAILTETAPVLTKQKKPSVDKGLMVILSPPVIGMTSKEWVPENNGFANVIRMVPKRMLNSISAENSIYLEREIQSFPPVPQPMRTPVNTAPTPAPQTGPQDFRHSVRELRSDVRALRRDVGRLLKILEKKETSWNELRRSKLTPAKPTVGAIHRRIKESKTDLLVFQASWSGPCRKMASLLDEQTERGYSIRRLDIDKNRELVKEFGVTSVPAIIAFSNGKEDERWVGLMGNDALTRIVDKYAPRQTAILKSSRQSSVTLTEHRLHQVLMREISLKSEKIPLVDVLRTLQQSEGINVYINSRGLEEEGVDPKTPITIDVKEITLKSALNLILNPLNLAYQVRDEVLVITSQQRAQGKMVVVTYPVADFAILIPVAGLVPVDKKTLSEHSPKIDFGTLTQIILSTVQPDSWEVVGGPATISPHDSTLSLVIRQSSEAHKEIEDLLAQLRRLQDMQVTVESRCLDHLPEDVWKQVDIDFDSKTNTNGPLGGVVLSDRQAELLLQTAQEEGSRANLTQGPKVTLFNGQTASVTDFMAGGKQHPLKHSLRLQPVISADRRNVRLNLRISDLEPPGAETRAYVNTVPDGKVLLIEIGRRDANKVGVPISEKSRRFKNTGAHRTKGHRFLLIRPRIIVQEEEAILPPQRKLQLMLTPRGIISEEEEELLGIEEPE